MVLSDLEQPMANLNIVDKEKKAYVQKFAEDVVEIEEESTICQGARETLINCFDHKYLFRAVFSGSDIRRPNGDLQARLFSPPEAVKSKEDAKSRVEYHLDKDSKKAGPFISLTSDLLRALNIAWGFACKKETGIKIFVIDTWKLRNGSFASCNELCESVGVEENMKYNNETIVWGSVPADAIVHEWSWERLQLSGLFKLFPALVEGNEYRSAKTLRGRIRLTSNTFSLGKMVDVLVGGLKMSPSTVLTQQISLMMLGWAHQRWYCYAKYFPNLQNTLREDLPGEVESLDKELHRMFMDWSRAKGIS